MNIEQINNHLQSCLESECLVEVTAVRAAKWLNEAGLLQDSSTRPGKPLRDLLRAHKIVGQEQRPNKKNGRWFIKKI